jgi:putative restriction endonuclease
MKDFNDLISNLPERHRTALTWFLKNRGSEQTWPKPLLDGTLLASKAQGIYKPSWTKYCLSIRQSLKSRYDDKELRMRPNGSWSLVYAQEASDPRSRDADYANRSLLSCMRDKVPIGVMKQVIERPISRYQILGVAVVVGHYESYFLIEGFATNRSIRGLESPQDLEALVTTEEKTIELDGEFSPEDIIDAREKTLASIIRRRGQPDFRRKLLELYGAKCAVTRCDVEEALEAVHILPYRGPQTNHPLNGLLLRADIHILFDLGLIAVDTSTMTVLISSSLVGTSYAEFAGTRLHLPEAGAFSPSKEALDQHRAWSGL